MATGCTVEAYALAWPLHGVARTHSCLVRFARLLWAKYAGPADQLLFVDRVQPVVSQARRSHDPLLECSWERPSNNRTAAQTQIQMALLNFTFPKRREGSVWGRLSDSSKAYCLATLCTGSPPSRRLFEQVKIQKGPKGVVAPEAVPLTRIIQPTSRWKVEPAALEGSRSPATFASHD